MAASTRQVILRNISLFQSLQSSLREPLKPRVYSEQVEKFKKAGNLWKKVFIFVCVPSIALCGVNVLLMEHEERPEFHPYEHLRIRTRRFPWGDGNKSLFHNPHTNALPDGYEEH